MYYNIFQCLWTLRGVKLLYKVIESRLYKSIYVIPNMSGLFLKQNFFRSSPSTMK